MEPINEAGASHQGTPEQAPAASATEVGAGSDFQGKRLPRRAIANCTDLFRGSPTPIVLSLHSDVGIVINIEADRNQSIPIVFESLVFEKLTFRKPAFEKTPFFTSPLEQNYFMLVTP
jgi:hypothetical protein